MSSVVKSTNGKYTYLYESVSYRNTNGNPRNHRVIIGKIDPSTNEPVYKAEYIERMFKNGTPVEIQNTASVSFTSNDIRQSRLKEYGAHYLFQSISEGSGLINTLRSVFAQTWEKIFSLACYLVSTGEPTMYFSDWQEKTQCVLTQSMSSQRISEFLASITHSERMEFFKQWGEYRSEQEYLALDITSVSSYSQLVDDVEWGYNRDGEKLPQVNLCLLVGEKSSLPVFQTIYSGSLKDVSTLKTTISQTSIIAMDKLLLVMDKGFCSKMNIDEMLLEPNQTRFVTAAPFTMTIAKKQVQSEKKDIDSLQNTIVLGDDVLRGVCKERVWSGSKKLFVHTFFNVAKATKQRENLYAHVTMLKQEAAQNHKNTLYQADFERYLLIRKSEKNDIGYTINIRQDVVEKELEHSGWLVLLSNDISEPKEALSIYRTKDVVEKGFMRFKNNLDMGRLRIHSDSSMQNKAFIGFVALIIMAGIHKVMSDKGLYKSMSMKKMIKTLEKLRIQQINETEIRFPITKEQKFIFKAFGLKEPL